MRVIKIVVAALITCAIPAAHAAETALISKNAAGTDAGNSYSGIDSFGGRNEPHLDRYVVFSSAATDLTGDSYPTGDEQAFWHDTALDLTELVSWNTSNTAAADGSSRHAAVSADGRWVAFESSAVDIHPLFPGGSDQLFVRDRLADVTLPVTINAAGSTAANDDSTLVGLSADGRYVLFTSLATDLVNLPDSNGGWDFFVRDLMTGTTTLVSVDASGTSTGDLGSPSGERAILADGGRYAAFVSYASDLVGIDTNGVADVFVRDLELGTTALVSVNEGGTASGNGESLDAFSFSQDGRWLVFASEATDLTNDPDGNVGGPRVDLFLRDLQEGETSLVSITPGGTSADFECGRGRVSEDGRFVVFTSNATNLAAPDSDVLADVFVRDMDAGTTELVSISLDGTTSGNGNSDAPEISTNGRYVMFKSDATNLVSLPDGNGQRDAFIRDLLLDQTDLVSVNGAGTGTASQAVSYATVSRDGRFISFHTDSSDLGPTDTNGESDVYRVEHDLAETVDFGDAPALYPVRYGEDGAMHRITSLFLGATVDGEPGAPAASPATGDDNDGLDDEDGVDIPAEYLPGVPADLDVTASGAGLLNAWIDFNRDGDWDDPEEQIFIDEALLTGVNTLTFTAPADALPGVTYARFRLDSGGGLTPRGFAADGEVEDYSIINDLEIFNDGFESGDTSAWSQSVP